MLEILGVRMLIDNEDLSRDQTPLGGHKCCTDPHRLSIRVSTIDRDRQYHIGNTLLMSREVSHDQHLFLVNNLNDEPNTHIISLGRAGKGIVVDYYYCRCL